MLDTDDCIIDVGCGEGYQPYTTQTFVVKQLVLTMTSGEQMNGKIIKTEN